MKAQIQIHINDTPITAEVTFGYIKGRPAYTPRGEYAPIDPPEPPEVDIQSIRINNPAIFNDEWHDCPAWLVNIVANDNDTINQLIEIAEEYESQEQERYMTEMED